MRRALLITGVFLGALLPLIGLRVNAADSPCTGTLSTTNTYFKNYDSVEYSPDGLLILNFKTTASTTQRKIVVDWLTKNDECAQGNVTNGFTDKEVIIPKGFTDFSIRFSSPSHYDIWNNASSTILTCPGIAVTAQGCSVDIPDFPDYYTFGWKAHQQNPTGGPVSTLQTTFHPIVLPPTVAPVQSETLPTPLGCTPYSYATATPAIFSNYERAEYVAPVSGGAKLLRVHYRMASPYNIGGMWKARMREHNAACAPSNNNFPSSNNADITPYTRYFSIRFVTPTTWELWNDELNIKEICTLCQGTIAPTASYVSFMGSNTPGSNYFRGTPYPVVEPISNSNVAFIPGIEASRLYKPSFLGVDKLWEPNIRNDIRQLNLDEQGRSLDPSIYVGNIIDEAPGGGNIYKSFIAQMDDLVDDGTIKKWKAFPYDWRLDYNDVLTAGTNIDGVKIEKMVDEVLSLASTSPSGKVTIIAHSHGGLVAKALIDKLATLGKAHLVDKLILVAVPQSGTPEAVAGLLHGDNSFGFPGNFVITHELFRALGEHAQAAINLLPTNNYFARVADPVVEFDQSDSGQVPELVKWRNMYGDSLDTPAEMRSFLSGDDDRTKPSASDTDSPNVLLSNFLDKFTENASTQDTWIPPATLKVTQIVGWGIETLRGIKYTEREEGVTCNTDLSVCLPRYVLDREPQMTTDGDKTVISYSADAMATSTWYVNLYKYSLPKLVIDRDHSDILEVPSVLDLVSTTLSASTYKSSEFLTKTKPNDPILSNRLSVHSPVSIDLYDSEGNHTGLIPNPDSNSDLPYLEEQVSNSRYDEFGEGKYISIPDEGGPYEVLIKGTGTGTFTLENEEGTGGNYSIESTFTDIPVLPVSVATLTLDSDPLELALDIDGNGTVDVTLQEGEEISASSLLDILEYQLANIDAAPKFIKKFSKKIAKVRKGIDAGEVLNAVDRLDKVAKLIDKSLKKGSLSENDAANLMQLVVQIKEAIL